MFSTINPVTVRSEVRVIRDNRMNMEIARQRGERVIYEYGANACRRCNRVGFHCACNWQWPLCNRGGGPCVCGHAPPCPEPTDYEVALDHWGRLSVYAREYLREQLGVTGDVYLTDEATNTDWFVVDKELLLEKMVEILHCLVIGLDCEALFVEGLPACGKSSIFNELTVRYSNEMVAVQEHPLVRSWLNAKGDWKSKTNFISEIHSDHVRYTFAHKPPCIPILFERDLRAEWTFSGDECDERPNTRIVGLSPMIHQVRTAYIYISLPMSECWRRMNESPNRSHEVAMGLDFHRLTEKRMEEKWVMCRDYDEMVRIDLSYIGTAKVLITVRRFRGKKCLPNPKVVFQRLGPNCAFKVIRFCRYLI